MLNNRLRGALATALAGMELVGGDAARQREAALILQRGSFDEPDAEQLPVIESALATASWTPTRARCWSWRRPRCCWPATTRRKRLEAAEKLGEARKAIVRPLLQQRMETEPDAAVKAALKASLAGLERSLAISSGLAEAFTGVSLGSILLLAALGLAITYGLMGVINMAHGELIMIGAYATWLVQSFFRDVVAGPV